MKWCWSSKQTVLTVLLSLCLFQCYLRNICMSEADTNNSFACGDGSTCYIKFSCSTFCVFYPMRNIFFLCFENNNVTSTTGQHRSQSVASLPSYLISHLTFLANVFKRQSAENGHFLCHFQTLTDNRL